MKKSFVLIINFIFLSKFIFSEEQIFLTHLYTYIDSPVVEQRQVLNEEEIESLHAESLPELFSSMGIQTLNYGSYGMQSNPSVRGFTGAGVRVVIDGVPVNSSQNGNFDFTSINVEDIEKIEVTRGAFTEDLAGEGAAGGVIYITTKKQVLGNSFKAGLSTKSFFNANCPLDSFSSDFSWNGQVSENDFCKASLSATLAANRFLYENNLGKIVEKKNEDVIDGNSNLQYTHFFGNGNYFSVSDLFYGGNKHVSGGGLQKDFNNKTILSLMIPSLATNFFSPVKISSVLAWKSSNQFYDASSEHSTHFLNEIVSDTSLSFPVTTWFKESLALQLEYDYLDSTNTGTKNIFSGIAKSTSVFYARKNISFSLPLSICFSNKNFAFVPKFGVCFSYRYADFLINVYRLMAFPTMNQLYWNGVGAHGNPNLKFESGWGGEVTVNLKNDILPLSVCVFTDYYKDSIHWGYENNVWIPLNLSSAFYLGCDIRAEKTLWNHLTLSASFEYLYNRLLDEKDSSTYGKMIMYTPDMVCSASAKLFFPSFMLLVDASYMGCRYEDNQNIYALSPYLLLNASAELKIFPVVTPYLRACNLLNQTYESIPNYPMPGFSLTVGMKFHF